MLPFFLYFIFGLHFPEVIKIVTEFQGYSVGNLWKAQGAYKVQEKQ